MIQFSEVECASFDAEGYVKVERVLEGERLAQVQAEFARVEEATREEWQRTVAEGVDFRPYKLGETAHVVFPWRRTEMSSSTCWNCPRPSASPSALWGPISR